MGDLEEAPVSWFRVSLALAIGAAWGVNQWTEDFPLCLFTSLHISLCNKEKKNNKNGGTHWRLVSTEIATL